MSRIASPLMLPEAIASWCAKTGGLAAHFTVRNRCNLLRRAHQLASAYPFLRFERSITQILTRSDPKTRGKEPKNLSKHAHDPLYEKRGWG